MSHTLAKVYVNVHLNSEPNDKILNQSKFKELTDDRIKANKKLKFVLGIEENILGKGENAGYQHFLIFPNIFKSLLPQGR